MEKNNSERFLQNWGGGDFCRLKCLMCLHPAVQTRTLSEQWLLQKRPCFLCNHVPAVTGFHDVVERVCWVNHIVFITENELIHVHNILVSQYRKMGGGSLSYGTFAQSKLYSCTIKLCSNQTIKESPILLQKIF